MKIIITDNLKRKYVSDRLIAENVCESYATIIVKLLNKREYKYSNNYFQVKPDDYKLLKVEP